MDDLEPLNIEFLINNPQVIADAQEVEATLQATNIKVQANADQAAKAIASVVNQENASINSLTASTREGLKLQVAQLQQLAALTPKDNLNKISAFNKQIEGLQTEINRLGNVGKAGFDAFGNAIPIDKMGKFETAINRVTDAQNIGARVVTQFTRQIISLGVGLISGIFGAKAIEALFSYLSSLNLFTEKLSETQKILKLTEEGIDSTDYKKAVSSIAELTENIQLAKKGFLDKSEVLTEYNKELGKSIGFANDLNTAEKLIVEKGQAYIKLTLLKATAQAALNDATKKQLDYEKALQSNTDPNSANNDKNDQSGFKNLTTWERLVAAFTQDGGVTQKLLEDGKARALKTAGDERDGLLKIYNNIEEEAAKLAKENHIDFFGGKDTAKPDAAIQAALNARQGILEKIDALEKEYARKSLDTNDQQIQAIKDKFTTLRSEIDKANALIDRENAKIKDPSKRVARVDGSVLSPVEDNAITNQLGIQDFEYYKTDLAKQKKLFDDFEAYKLKVGTDKANARFAAELNGNQSYIEYLQKELSSDRIDPNDKSEGTAKRKELLLEQLQQALAAQKENFTKLLESVQTYETQRANLTATYQDKRKELIAAGNTQEVAILDEQYKEQLSKLDDANFEKLQSVKELYSGITDLSSSASKKLIADVQTELDARIAAGTISAAEAKKTQDLIDKSKDSLDKRLPAEIDKAAQGLHEMASAASILNTQLGDAVNLLATVATNISKGISAYNDLQKATKNNDTFGGITSAFGIIGSAFSVITTVASLFDHSKEEAQQEQYVLQEQIKSIQVINSELQRQLEITKQLYGPERISGYLDQLSKIKEAEQAAQSQIDSKLILTGTDKNLDASVSKLNEGQKLNVFDKTNIKIYDELMQKLGLNASLAGKNVDQLEQLLDQGKLDDKTAALVQSLADLQQQAIDTQNALNADLTGTSFDSLTSAIVQMFQDGKTSLQDFGSEFQSTMQTAILNAFKRDYLEKQLQGFYDDLAGDVKAHGQLTSDDIAKLQTEYNTILQNASTQFDQLQKVTGVPLTTQNTASSGGGISGAVKGITETTANAVEGAVRGMQLSIVQSNSLLATGNKTMQDQLSEIKNQTLLQMQIVANTKRTADNTDDMKVSLKNIDKNTSDTAGNVLRAAGIVS